MNKVKGKKVHFLIKKNKEANNMSL